MPDTTVGAHAADYDAVPKVYVDDKDRALQDQIDNINDIFCELSIWDEKIVIRSIASDNYDLKKILNYILKSIIHDKLPKNWNL